jgi:hypothetical protein
MAFYFLSGSTMNLLSNAASVTMTPTADTLYPLTQAYDGKSYLAAKFSSSTSNPYVTVDLGVSSADAFGWPGFEALTEPPADSSHGTWTAGSSFGSIERSTDHFYGGIAALHIHGSLDFSSYIDFYVSVSQSRTIQCEFVHSGPSGYTNMFLKNINTSNYLSSAGTSWGSSSNIVAQNASSDATGWTTVSVPYTVQTSSECGSTAATLRLYFNHVGIANQGVYVDDLYDFIGTGGWSVNFIGIFGTQNWSTGLTPKVLLSTDNFATATTQSMTLTKPVTWKFFSSPITQRYIRIQLDGTPSQTPGCGEIVIGQAEPLLRMPNNGPQVKLEEVGQIRRSTLSGAVKVRNLSSWPLREWSNSFRFVDSSGYLQFRDDIFKESRGGALPMILFDDSGLGLEYPLFGVCEASVNFVRLDNPTQDWWDASLTLTELPFPNL